MWEKFWKPKMMMGTFNILFLRRSDKMAGNSEWLPI
jgi:hypothetical protein